jgi:uncharacterized membrane protein YkoI
MEVDKMNKKAEKTILVLSLIAVLLIGSLVVTATYMKIKEEEKIQVTEVAGSNADNPISIISKETAVQIASGYRSGEVEEVSLHRSNGALIYSIEIKGSDMEYDIHIDALNGNVVGFTSEEIEAEDDDTDEEEPFVSSLGARITEEQAKQIALDEVGGTVTDTDTDRVNGRDAWEIEIRKNGNEYDVLVDMETGDVLKVEKD